MSGAVQRFARRWWAGRLGPLGLLLDLAALPLAWTWGWASRFRAWRRAGRGARVERLMVVSVGNLAVGGTGKTPVAAYLARRLATAGLPTTVISGPLGHDETMLHARWTESVSAVAAPDRVAAAAAARASGSRAVVLDDGFQHFRLARDLDVVLLSADDPFPGPLLPRGPYRETPLALERADALVVTRRRASEESARALAVGAARWARGVGISGARLAPVALAPLRDWAEGVRADATLSGEVLAVCGIARPDGFRAAVAERIVGTVDLMPFADHHRYTAADAQRIAARARGRPVVLTEKDAVKLARHGEALGPAYVLVEELQWEWGEEGLGALVDGVVREGVGS